MEWLLGGALAVISLAYFAIHLPWPGNLYDIGVRVAHAMRLLAGETPYVDFQTLYTPGEWYTVAAAFELLGYDYQSLVHLHVLLLAGNAWFGWWVARRLGAPHLLALLPFAAGLAFTYPYQSLLCAYTALVVAAGGTGTAGWRRVLAVGVLAGICGYLRQDNGGVLAFAVMATVAVRRPADATTGPITRDSLVRALGVGAVAAGVLALLLSPGLLHDPRAVLDGILLNPAATGPYRSTDAPWSEMFSFTRGMWDLVGILSMAAGIAAVATALPWVRRRMHESIDVPLLVGLGVLSAWGVRYYILRPDSHHLVPAALVLTITVTGLRWRGNDGMWVRAGLCAVAAMVTAGPLFHESTSRIRHLLGRRPITVEQVGPVSPTCSTLWLQPDHARAYREVIRTLRELTDEGEPFLSALDRHDRIHSQDLVLHFAADRPPAVFDYHFDPGVTTEPDIQQGVIDDAEQADIRVVVRYRPGLGRLPEGFEPGALLLDEWIEREYAEYAKFGRYAIWLRKGDPAWE